jgi:hypothetical protein
MDRAIEGQRSLTGAPPSKNEIADDTIAIIDPATMPAEAGLPEAAKGLLCPASRILIRPLPERALEG